jgi:hypothetical protein
MIPQEPDALRLSGSFGEERPQYGLLAMQASKARNSTHVGFTSVEKVIRQLNAGISRARR